MIRKEYSSSLNMLSIVVSINGKNRHIDFENGHRVGKFTVPSHYTTCNLSEQKAIESHRYFGNLIKLSKTTGSIEPVQEKPLVLQSSIVSTPITNSRVYSEITTAREAMSLLTSAPFNLRIQQCNSKSKINKRIKELNISFPNIIYDL